MEKTIVLQSNRKNFNDIMSGKKKEDYRLITESNNICFSTLGLTIDNGQLYYKGKAVDESDDIKIKFKCGYQTHWRHRITATVRISIGYGKAEYGGNPTMLYWVLKIQSISKQI